MLVAQLLFRHLFAVVARAMIPKKPRWSYQVWGAKVTRCCDSIFKCCYYCAMTTWCFALLRDQPYLPRLLGGSGDTRNCWRGYPFQDIPSELCSFYLTAVGYHLSEVAMLLLEAARCLVSFEMVPAASWTLWHPDFWEMLLHHIVTWTPQRGAVMTVMTDILQSASTQAFMLPGGIGSLVLLLHGVTDIFVYLSKDGHRRAHNLLNDGMQENHDQASPERVVSWGFINFGLFTLFLLHMYWFGMIIKIGTHYRQTGQARDLQSNLSSMDMDKKRT
ncbi:hyl-1 [Symbiodinium natans]|uniref:Hyl-1 protein n=1 Tax=Symbiodinium natans TaxID=878477 RepID=A0A812V0U1_9DINO|nr:hyl-1 [Symbiodinium natans]